MRRSSGSRGKRLLICAAVALAVVLPERGDAPAEGRSNLLSLEGAVKTASVTLVPGVCGGAVVLDRTLVLTAAHCIDRDVRHLRVALSSGRRVGATVLSLDRSSDLALLRLGRSAHVRPLGLATALPRAGEQLLFVGRADRGERPQVAEVVRLGRCPSLPDVPEAVFTTIDAHKGDSGAPIVDASLRVVGIVHGGARCHIAAPTATLGRLMRELGFE